MKLTIVISGCLLVVVGFSFIMVQLLLPSSPLLYWFGLAFSLIGILGGVLFLFLALGGEKADVEKSK